MSVLDFTNALVAEMEQSPEARFHNLVASLRKVQTFELHVQQPHMVVLFVCPHVFGHINVIVYSHDSISLELLMLYYTKH